MDYEIGRMERKQKLKARKVRGDGGLGWRDA